MAVALRYIRDRVRRKLRDNDARKPTYDSIEIDQEIAEQYILAQSCLPPPYLYTPNAFTISASADTFTLPATVSQWTGNDGGAEYAGDVRIQLVSTGQFLDRRSVQYIDGVRHGHPTTVFQIPREFALWEEKDQDVQGRCYPGAQAAQVCNLFAAMKADDLRDYVGAGTDGLDEVEAQLSREATLALVLMTSAVLLESMDEEDAKLRRVNPKAAASWRMEAERLLYREAGRRHDLEDAGMSVSYNP